MKPSLLIRHTSGLLCLWYGLMTVQSFHLPRQSIGSPRCRQESRRKAATDGTKDNDDREALRSSKRRKVRGVDFPAFALDDYTPSRKIARKKSETKPKSEATDYDESSSPFEKVLSLELPFFGKEKKPPGVASYAKATRLLKSRAYATMDAFEKEHISRPPNVSDLSAPVGRASEKLWVTSVFRVFVLIIAYAAFPLLTKFLDHFVTMEPDQLDDITSKFSPGISILYATYSSITLSILYNRQQCIQEHVAIESSLIALTTRNLLALFQKDAERAIEGCQCIADQIRTLVKNSRGKELMCLMYTDPYSRILGLIEEKEIELFDEKGNFGPHGAVIANLRDSVKDLITIRANRLSDESLALPPTHFFVLITLTFLILLGYTVSILPTVGLDGRPSNETSMLFAILCGIYVLFYNFAKDMNNPFSGVYQIKRSSTACHLLQTKWLISNHPLLQGEVDFDEIVLNEEQPNDKFSVWSPGLGDMNLERKKTLGSRK